MHQIERRANPCPLWNKLWNSVLLCRQPPGHLIQVSSLIAAWALIIHHKLVLNIELSSCKLAISPASALCYCAFFIDPAAMEVEQVLGFSGVVGFPLACTPLHVVSACVWQIHHRLCRFVVVIRSLLFMA